MEFVSLPKGPFPPGSLFPLLACLDGKFGSWEKSHVTYQLIKGKPEWQAKAIMWIYFFWKPTYICMYSAFLWMLRYRMSSRGFSSSNFKTFFPLTSVVRAQLEAKKQSSLGEKMKWKVIKCSITCVGLHFLEFEWFLSSATRLPAFRLLLHDSALKILEFSGNSWKPTTAEALTLTAADNKGRKTAWEGQ